MRVLSYVIIVHLYISSLDYFTIKHAFYQPFINLSAAFIYFQITGLWWTQNTIFLIFICIFVCSNFYSRISTSIEWNGSPKLHRVLLVFFHFRRIPVVYLDRNAEKIRHVRFVQTRWYAEKTCNSPFELEIFDLFFDRWRECTKYFIQ